jgi:hypothetical protein
MRDNGRVLSNPSKSAEGKAGAQGSESIAALGTWSADDTLAALVRDSRVGGGAYHRVRREWM